MYLGRVVGRVVCTAKDELLSGIKMLLVRKIDQEGKAFGKAFVACDSVGAGEGETVFLCGGGEAAFPFIKKRPPSDASIIGIIDSIEG
jgi:microcompartment protein CcmK/EutM